jgi:outer membrane immunogenic protein
LGGGSVGALPVAGVEFAMKKILLGAIALAAASAAALPASAADMRMPTKAPLLAATPAYNWSGLYLGVHGGAQWLESETSFFYPPTPASGARDLRTTSAIIGAQIGYNWMLNPSLLVGIEADLSWADHNDGAQLFRFAVDHFDGRNDLGVQGSLRGRLGFVNNNWLFYATAGVAFGDTSSSTIVTRDTVGSLVTTKDETLAGWTVGAGVDVMLTRNWIAGVEYRYTDFGSVSIAVPAFTFPAPGGAYTAGADYQTHALTFRVNYKF